MRLIILNVLFLLVVYLLFTGCSSHKADTWYKYYPFVGTYSSPRMADLNGDEVLDIVIGAGGKEDEHSEFAVIAVDGTSGELLWKIEGYNQYVGSAVFKDINADGIDDVFIGGRWAQFSAISGRDGSILWTFLPQRSSPNAAGTGWFNFSTAQFIPDQDQDGLDDLIISNGGNSLAAPGDTNRPAGRILVLSSATGRLLGAVTVPDNRETYMSVVCLDAQQNGNPVVLFGTGGETIGGHLYKTTLGEIMKGDISKAVPIATSTTKGFVAPPVFVDVNGDKVHDIIVNQVDGAMLAINGQTDSLIWKVVFPGTEAYTVPAIGYFNGDSIPDLFCNFAIGTFPKLERSIRFMLDGRTGGIHYQDTIRSFQYASAVVVDVDGDGIDEVLTNQSELIRKDGKDHYFSYLMAFDFKNNQRFPIGDTMAATNLASTPWIGDIDDDDQLDIIYSAVKYDDVRFDLQRPQGLLLGHYRSPYKIKKTIHWGAYMGTAYSGVFPTN